MFWFFPDPEKIGKDTKSDRKNGADETSPGGVHPIFVGEIGTNSKPEQKTAYIGHLILP